MTKKPNKPELEDALNIVITMWDGGSFSSMIKNGNEDIAHFADDYWDEITTTGQKDALSKTDFFKALLNMPVLSVEDRCRMALNTAMRLRQNSFRPVWSSADISNLAEQLWRDGADQRLRDACIAALQGHVYECASFACGYGQKHIPASRRILSAWMAQK